MSVEAIDTSRWPEEKRLNGPGGFQYDRVATEIWSTVTTQIAYAIKALRERDLTDAEIDEGMDESVFQTWGEATDLAEDEIAQKGVTQDGGRADARPNMDTGARLQPRSGDLGATRSGETE